MKGERMVYMSPVGERANVLLDAWLRGMVQGGHHVTGEAIGEVRRASVARARREGLSERYEQRAIPPAR